MKLKFDKKECFSKIDSIFDIYSEKSLRLVEGQKLHTFHSHISHACVCARE